MTWAPLPGDSESSASGINNFGQIVGSSTLAGRFPGRGWIYLHGQKYDLNELLNPAASGWTIFEGRAINGRGQILANATYGEDFHSRPVILTPQYP